MFEMKQRSETAAIACLPLWQALDLSAMRQATPVTENRRNGGNSTYRAIVEPLGPKVGPFEPVKRDEKSCERANSSLGVPGVSGGIKGCRPNCCMTQERLFWLLFSFAFESASSVGGNIIVVRIFILLIIYGSEQEFDKKPISRGFPKSHEFGLGDGHTLSLEE
jgi:hypothetical protein